MVIVDDDSPPEARLTPNADGTYTVPASWPLVPRGIGEHGGTFRLLFVTTNERDATSSDIADYDAFVQASARGEHFGGAHEALKPYASLFKVVGSTATPRVNAIDHIDTETHPDAPVYWLGGRRVLERQSDFFSGGDTPWRNWGVADRRTASSASTNDIGTRMRPVFTGTHKLGVGSNGGLGGTGTIFSGSHEDHPIQGPTQSRTNSLPFYAISPVFRVEPRPRLEFDGAPTFHAFTAGLLDRGRHGAGVGRMLVADEPAACGQSANDVSAYGPITHNSKLATYRVRLRQAPHGPATFAVYNPQPLKYPHSSDLRPFNGYRGGVSVRPAGEPTTYVERRGGVTHTFDDGNWDQWLTVNLNVHCADHQDHEAYTIAQYVRLPGDLYTVPTGRPGEVAQRSRAFYEDVHVKVVDTKSSAQPSDLSVSTAYGGTLTAAAGQGGGGHAYTYTGADGVRRWFFSLAYYWDTRGKPPSTLIGNWHQPGAGGIVLPVSGGAHAQAFTTGPFAAGYTLTSVDIVFRRISEASLLTSGLVVTIRSDSGGAPGALLGTLANPTLANGSHEQSYNFTHSGLTLQPNTVYWLRVDNPPLNALDNQLSATSSNGEDRGRAAGWSIANQSLLQSNGNTWAGNAAGKLIIRVNGREGGTRNDVLDATKHFSAFKVRIEGDDSLSPPVPTYVTSRSPAFHPGVSASDGTNRDPYHVASPNYGLVGVADILVADHDTNPGDPVYRFTITPVTIRNAEAPGETVTVCVQLQSFTDWPARKKAVKVDCSLFNAPTGEVEVIGLGYLMAQMGGSTQPTLTIAGDAFGVTEGGDVTYTITANPPPAADTTVTIVVTERMGSGGDAIGIEQVDTLVIPAGASSVTWTVTTYSDDVERDDGTIVAQLNPGDGYALGDPSSVSMTLLDDDGSTPEISISGGGGITEGGDASFTVTASPAPSANLDVKVTITQSGDYGATTGQRTATIPTSGSVTFTVGTTDDSADEADGSVTATVNAGSGYTVSSSQGAATVSVADNDGTPDYTDYQTVVDYLIQVRDNPENTAVQGNPAHILKWNRVLAAIGYNSGEPAMPASEIHANAARWPDSPFKPPSVYLKSQAQTPVVSISGGSGITEGGSASFTVSASPAPSANLDVKVTVTQSGDYGATTGQRTVTVPTTGSVTFTVGTTDDSADEADGSVTATVDAGTGYTVSSSQGAATVSVADNDDAPPPPPTPVVSVSGGNGITEGGSASFTVSASPAPSANLDVKVTVTQSGDYGATTGQRTVTIPTSGSVTFTVGTTDDSADETDGSVTATVDAGTGYTVSSSQGAATVSVADNDDAPTPVVSVTGGSGITEGGDASFTVTASPAPSANLDVKVTVTQSGDYGATTGQRTVTVPTSGSVTFTVSTTDDSADEADGSVTATLVDGAAYDLGTSKTATVTVSDNDDPTPVVSVSGGSGITEGGDASFTVSASPAPSANLDVKVTVTQSGDYGATTGQRTVTVPTTGSVTFTVGTTDDSADEADGSVTATVDAGTGYTVSSSQGAATVSVADNDDAPPPPPTPVVSVSGGNGITEGGSASFTVSASPAPSANLDVKVTVTQSGDYGATTGQRTVTIPTSGSVTFTVGTTDDSADETDGSVTATVDAGSGYTVSSSQGAATVSVADNDDAPTPVVSVTGGSGITEGGDASFTVTASPAPSANLDVKVTVTQSGDYGATTGQRTVTVPTSGSVTFTVSTTDDSADEADGSVTATLVDGAAYDLGTSKTATVTVSDNDDPTPVVSVSGGSGITEGGDASFTVSASPAPSANLDVKVTITQSGDYGATTGQRTVTVPTSGSVTFTVSTTDDSADETDGSVTATVNAGTGYTVSSSQGAATVSVADNDDAPPPPPTPVVSVSGGSGITEGGSASFTVSASPAPSANLDVKVTVTQSGDYGATTGQRTVTVPTSGSVTFTVATTDDSADETDGSVTATVDAGTGYTVSSSQGAATVGVADNDDAPTPVVSVTGGSGITEGGDASFTVTASPAPSANLDVKVTVTQSGDYGATTGQRTVTVPTSGSVTFTVSTTDDSADEADGSVTATLVDGAAYDLGTSKTATVTVSDNDDPTPVVSVSGGSGITEGGDASFTVSASPAPSANLDVKVTITQSGDYGATTGQRTVTVPTSGSVTFTVSTTDDSADETDGSVTATVNAGTGYTVSSSQGAATVSVADNDDAPPPPPTPVVSVSGGSGITEGGSASFTVSASPAPSANLDVKVTVTQSGDYGATTGQRTVTVPTSGSVTFTVATTDDSADETDGSVTATVDAGTGYTVSSSQGAATVSVADNDDAPEISVTVEDASATEGGVLTFRVRLSAASAEEITIKWYTAPAYDRVDDRAHTSDYQAAEGELVFAPGVTELTGEVWLEQDDEDEPDEYFAVEAFLPGNFLQADAVGTMTIVDDD